MTTIKATERSITLLALRNLNNPIKLRANNANKIVDTIGKEKRAFGTFNFRQTKFSIKAPKVKNSVKCNNAIALSSTLAARENIPLINPNKHTPMNLKELSVEPIAMPKTMPRFTHSTGDIPSVTKVLQATMPAASKYVLDKWKEGMIKKLGIEGFNKYTRDTFERGRALHAVLANYLLGMGDPVEGVAEMDKEITCNLWNSIKNVVQNKISNVRLVEHTVTHSELNYRGIIDCVAFYEDELVVIDFKTAEKTKKTVEALYDNPLQVTAYCGALNNDTSIPKNVIDRNIRSGLVIVAYVDGSEASTYYLKSEEVEDYWKKWVSRLDQYTRLDAMFKASNKKIPYSK